MDLLRATEHHTRCPFKGDAAWWSVVGDRVVDNAVWSYPRPPDHAPDLAGHVAFDWDAMDAWYEEDERIFGHARDPYHRIDVVPSSRPVTVTVADRVVASSRRPRVLFETGLPPRWYLPWEDGPPSTSRGATRARAAPTRDWPRTGRSRRRRCRRRCGVGLPGPARGRRRHLGSRVLRGGVRRPGTRPVGGVGARAGRWVGLLTVRPLVSRPVRGRSPSDHAGAAAPTGRPWLGRPSAAGAGRPPRRPGAGGRRRGTGRSRARRSVRR